MIGQHLILRCTKGAYDRSSSPGYKVAAVSDNIKKLPLAQQTDINKVILSHSQIPDVVKKPIGFENRGILRIYQFNGMILAMRSFRVYDLCDTHGDVSYVHTYIATDSDRRTLLEHPESLADITLFDKYENVNRRAGGLSEGNEITVNTDLVIPNPEASVIERDIFSECGFDENSFSRFISSVCQHISVDGWVALLLKGVDETFWNRTGGSEIGELFLAKLISLLPNCIARFFSGVSYWDESFVADSIKDLKVRVLSGRHMDGLLNNAISLFDFHNDRIESKFDAGFFGTYLWKNRNNIDEIARFHAFIEKIFGKNVDRVLKIPELMNTITELYLFDNNYTNELYENIDLNAVQDSAASVLRLLGSSLSSFPELYALLLLCLDYIKQNTKNQPISEKLEQISVSLMHGEQIKALGEKVEQYLAYILFYNIWCDAADDSSIKFTAKRIALEKDSEFCKYFANILKNLKMQSFGRISSELCLLLRLVYEMSETEMLHKDLWDVLIKLYNLYLKREAYSNCIAIAVTLLSNMRTESELIDVCEKLRFLIDNKNSDSNREYIVASLSTQIDKYKSQPETIVKIGKSLFGTETFSDIAASEDFFPLFVRILPCAVKCDEDYLNTVWLVQYEYILNNYMKDLYVYPEKFIQNCTGIARTQSLYKIELIRLTNNKLNHHVTEFALLDDIINSSVSDQGSKSSYGYCCVIDLMTQNSEESKKNIVEYYSDSDIIYKLFIYSYFKCFGDGKSLIVDNSYYEYVVAILMHKFIHKRDMYEKIEFNLKKEDLFNNYFSQIYHYIWYEQNKNATSETLYNKVVQVDKVMANHPKRFEIMLGFARYFKKILQSDGFNSTIPNLEESIIELIYKGINEYNWQQSIKINSTQQSIIEMCYFIDDKKDDHVDYFINILDQAFGNNDFSIIRLCAKRFRSSIRTICVQYREEKFMEKMSLLAIVHTCSQRGRCGDYLKVIRGDQSYWGDALFIMYGLKYLLTLRKARENTIQSIVNSFVDKLKEKIENAVSDLDKERLRSDIYYELYTEYIRPNLSTPQQQKLYDAARKNGNAELKDMFRVKYDKTLPLNLNYEIKWYISLCICILLVITVFLIHFFVHPIVALAVSVILFVCVTTFLVFSIVMKIKGSSHREI